MANTNSTSFCKIRFTSEHGSTAGLVIPARKVKHSTLSELSAYFPMFEANKMRRFESSPEYRTFDAAFAHEFGGEA